LAHISRKELKTDELRDTLAHGAEAVLSHQQVTLYVIVAAAVVALAVFGWRAYSERQTMKAAAGYNDAMKVFQARVRAPGEPVEPGEVTYVDEKNKFTDGAKKFGDVALAYPRTRAGQLSAYYAALSLEKLDKIDDAKKWLKGIADSDSDFASLAKFELAKLDDRAGQGDEAANLYQQLIAKSTVLVPKAVAMIALAEHYSQKNPVEAAKLYGQIKTEFPDTPIANQADQELALLPGKS
jgi:predicted negative regulator of RcsB-dependent stress response